MPRGRFAQWDDEVLRSYGDELADAAERAAERVGGWNVHTIAIGRFVVAFRSTDPETHAMIVRATWHLTTGDHASATISICDTATTACRAPLEPTWASDHWRHEGSSTVLLIDRDRDAVAFSDVAAGTALWWISSQASLPAWERPAPLRALIDRLLGPIGATLVHGGVVGDERGGVLFGARGGSGKSTSIYACVAAGMKTGGDDFLLLHDDEPSPVAWSMYATARLLPTSPAWSTFTGGADAIEAPIDDDSGDPNLVKRTLFLGEMFPGSVARSFAIEAVVVPMVATSFDTSVVPIRPAQALLALAPSSMLQLDPRRSALRTIADLVSKAPCFSLRLGRELAQVPIVVASILEEACSGRPRRGH